MTSCYIRDHKANGRYADEFADMLSAEGRSEIINGANFFEGIVYTPEIEYDAVTNPTGVRISEGERLALKRAMARFVIDSGIASARGWV